MKKTHAGHQPKFSKVFRLFLLAFVAIFLMRWAYECFFTNHDILLRSDALTLGNAPLREYSITNYATDKIVQKGAEGQTITLDQKYAQTANLSSVTSEFARDNAALRQAVEEEEAVVQSENLSGLPGTQTLTMVVGVTPRSFDALVERIRGIGTVHSFSVNKEDKTEEYRRLLASQETLSKTQASYLSLKEMGGDIQDLLLLEDKILEVEKSLQEMGVNIGLYAEEQSFCTVNFTLREAAVEQISMRFVLRCAQNSFFWTLGAFALLTLILCMAWVFAAVWLRAVELLKREIAPREPVNTPPKPERQGK